MSEIVLMVALVFLGIALTAIGEWRRVGGFNLVGAIATIAGGVISGDGWATIVLMCVGAFMAWRAFSDDKGRDW